MNERRRIRTGFRADLFEEEEVICPKPRRVTNVSCPAPEFLKPSRRRRRSHTTQVRTEGDAGFEILDIFLSRSGFGDSSNFGCSPPYFCGSPPSRSGNPLFTMYSLYIKELHPLSLPCLPYRHTLSKSQAADLHMAGVHPFASRDLPHRPSRGVVSLHLREKIRVVRDIDLLNHS